MNETIKLILDARKENRIVFNTIEGVMGADIEEFLKQPAEGILYDLNRDAATTLSFAETDPKWVNDFAAGFVITRLKEKLEEIEGKLAEMEWKLFSKEIPKVDSYYGFVAIYLSDGNYVHDAEFVLNIKRDEVFIRDIKTGMNISEDFSNLYWMYREYPEPPESKNPS